MKALIFLIFFVIVNCFEENDIPFELLEFDDKVFIDKKLFLNDTVFEINHSFDVCNEFKNEDTKGKCLKFLKDFCSKPIFTDRLFIDLEKGLSKFELFLKSISLKELNKLNMSKNYEFLTLSKCIVIDEKYIKLTFKNNYKNSYSVYKIFPYIKFLNDSCYIESSKNGYILENQKSNINCTIEKSDFLNFNSDYYPLPECVLKKKEIICNQPIVSFEIYSKKDKNYVYCFKNKIKINKKAYDCPNQILVINKNKNFEILSFKEEKQLFFNKYKKNKDSNLKYVINKRNLKISQIPLGLLDKFHNKQDTSPATINICDVIEKTIDLAKKGHSFESIPELLKSLQPSSIIIQIIDYFT